MLSQNKSSEITQVNQNIFSKSRLVKELFLLLIALLTGFGGWFTYALVLDNSFFSVWPVALVAGLIFCLYLALMSFVVSLSGRSIFITAVALASLLPLVAGFNENYLVMLFFIFVLQVIAWVVARVRMGRVIKNQISFSLFPIVRDGLGEVIYIFLLIISALYFIDSSTNDNLAFDLEGKVKAYGAAGINLAWGGINGYNPLMTVDEFISWYGESGALSSGSLRVEKYGLPADLEKTLNQIILNKGGNSFLAEQRAMVRSQFFAALGIGVKEGISGQSTMQELWESFVIVKARPYLASYQRFIPGALALGLFFSLIVFLFFYKLIIFVFAWLILQLLLLVKFIIFQEKQIIVKRLSL